MKTLIKNLLDKSTVKESNNYSFIPEFEQIINRHLANYGETKKGLKSFLEDLQHGGCISGMVGEFIYHSDNKEFYIKHIDDLYNFKSDLEDQLGEPIQNRHETQQYTFIVWLCFEEYCFDLYRAIFED